MISFSQFKVKKKYSSPIFFFNWLFVFRSTRIEFFANDVVRSCRMGTVYFLSICRKSPRQYCLRNRCKQCARTLFCYVIIVRANDVVRFIILLCYFTTYVHYFVERLNNHRHVLFTISDRVPFSIHST